MIELTNENFEETVLKSEIPVLVDFSATWCGPCKRVAPIIEKIGEDYAGKALVVKCDVEECDEVARQYGIMSIPTVLFFKNGQVVDKQVSLSPEKVYVEKLEKLL